MWLVTGAGGRAFMDADDPLMLTGPVESAARPMTAALQDGRKVSIITGYQSSREFLTDPRHSRAAVRRTPAGPASAMAVIELDPPRHTFIRGTLNRMFSYRAIRELEERVKLRATRLAEVVARSGPPADLVSTFCLPFAFGVQCDLLGVPDYARADIQRLSVARSGRPGLTAAEIYDAEIALHRAVSDATDHIHREGGRGIYAEFVAMTRRKELTEAELTGLASSLFFDGPLLASAQIANAVLGLLIYPQQRQLLARNPAHLSDAVEELLRWCPSITLGPPRVAWKSFDAGDAVIKPGELATVAFGLVNRDGLQFTEPDRLDISRSPNYHLVFGRGIHHCLGAHVMRLELQVALSVLLLTLPDISLAEDETSLEWMASHSIRWLPRLPVMWGPHRPVTGPWLARGTGAG